jgi:hypothetical protein
MLRIQKIKLGAAVVFVLSGRIEAEHLPQLNTLIKTERCRVALDLKEVSLVSREVVRFLALCEDKGIKIETCPCYVRKWMALE